MRRYSRRGMLLLLLLFIASYVQAAPLLQIDDFRAFVLEARTDLELFANSVLGEGVRPQTWTFNLDPNTKTFIADLWFDNEQLADAVFGVGSRPPEWIGATSSNASIVARNIRHDIELAADSYYTPRGERRPSEWRGAPPVFRCSRTVQNLLLLLETLYNEQSTTPAAVLDYCATVKAEIEDVLTERIYSDAAAQEQIPDLILAVRGDLERLADEKLGLNVRPLSYIRNVDPNSPTLASDIFLDLENLANELLGNQIRPQGWIGTIASSQAITFRNLRHDLELLADTTMGEGIRPRGWQGADPLQRCVPEVQSLVFVVSANYGFTVSDEMRASPDFCSVVEFSANNVAENPPIEEIQEAQVERYMGESRYAFAYLDVAALQYMGQMPAGTEFRAWYRNFAGSNMMFVSGQDFAVFIDRRWTSLAQDVFDTLPTLEGVKPLTFCDARWCNGPGPTPTPTGDSPLIAILNASTPFPTVSAAQVGSEGKAQVSWNHVRVTYLLDNATTNTAQVTLEICQEPAQITCEPVVRVFDNATGTNKAVLSQLNGLNVYEFPYGYTANLIIEGASLFSPDVWISDPTIR